jgi:hypothetical protein
MFWKSRASNFTISAELHEKILRTCPPIEHDSCEIVSLRSRRQPTEAPTAREPQPDAVHANNLGARIALRFCY